MSVDGGRLVPPAYLTEVSSQLRAINEAANRHREAARLREEARWAALTPMQRTIERARRRAKLLRLAAWRKRREVGMRIAGLDESDLGDGW